MSVRAKSIQYGARKVKARKNLTVVLENKLTRLHKQIADNDFSLFNEVEGQMLLVKKDLEKLYQLKAQKAKLQCKLTGLKVVKSVQSTFFLNYSTID